MLLLQLGIGPRPILLPQEFQLAGRIGLAALMEETGRRTNGRDE
jgi:hypothetical protein